MTQPGGFVEGPPRRVLVVDDDADFAESLSDLLGPHGFDVRTAHGAREAVGTLSSFAADLALVDVKLGADNGLHLVPQLKGRRPAITCILMTAYAALDSAIEAVSSGAEDYLLKPLEPADVIEKVRRIFVRNEEVRRRELEQRLILLGNVCAGIAHDVNGCLQTMLSDVGDIDAALATSPPGVESARAGAAALAVRVRVASDACRRILTFARGATSAHGCNASSALRECTLALEKLLPATVTLSIRVPEEELRVPLDPAQFQQVVVNLAVNAIHAIEDRGMVRIDLDTLGSGAGRRVRLSVTDDGRGIPESDLSSIFDPYFSTKPPSEAASLGLSVVHGLVKAAGGQVRVESSTEGADRPRA